MKVMKWKDKKPVTRALFGEMLITKTYVAENTRRGLWGLAIRRFSSTYLIG
jgi:hypothetical protein